LMLRKASIIARAKQTLGAEGNSGSTIKRNFSHMAKYHPDKRSPHIEQAKVLIEAYKLLTGRVKPLDCKLLERDDLVASPLPKGIKPVKLGVRHEDWFKETFYDFIKPE